MFAPKLNPKPRDVEIRPDTDSLVLDSHGRPDWGYYDYVMVSFSGGKDSLACVLYMLELGCPPEKLQLWHQPVDGALEPGERNFFDWPITEDYCRAVAEAIGARFSLNKMLYFQWKIGGFKGEMLRENQPTAGICFENQRGKLQCLGPGAPHKLGTRLKFPQPGRDLGTRWCTSYLKIDVMARALSNDKALDHAKILMVTGERREESGNRAAYAEVERHKSTTRKRRVTQWRAVIDWSEWSVWKIIERWKITPHPCYLLGFGRCSCITCIFGQPDQWATVQELVPELVSEIAWYEREFGVTINRKKIDAEEVASLGEPFPEVFTEKHQRRLALATEYPRREILTDDWDLPMGAGRGVGGPV